jgi:single-strand DNA-binding protein
MYLNKIQIIGNLTRDPELKSLPSSKIVVNFTVATSRKFKNAEGEDKENTEFHNCVAFGKSAELIHHYMKKGQSIYVEGRNQTRSWEVEDKKNYRTEIMVENFQFGPKVHAEPNTPNSDEAQYPDEDINPEDIPF